MTVFKKIMKWLLDNLTWLLALVGFVVNFYAAHLAVGRGDLGFALMGCFAALFSLLIGLVTQTMQRFERYARENALRRIYAEKVYLFEGDVKKTDEAAT